MFPAHWQETHCNMLISKQIIHPVLVTCDLWLTIHILYTHVRFRNEPSFKTSNENPFFSLFFFITALCGISVLGAHFEWNLF